MSCEKYDFVLSIMKDFYTTLTYLGFCVGGSVLEWIKSYFIQSVNTLSDIKMTDLLRLK